MGTVHKLPGAAAEPVKQTYTREGSWPKNAVRRQVLFIKRFSRRRDENERIACEAQVEYHKNRLQEAQDALEQIQQPNQR